MGDEGRLLLSEMEIPMKSVFALPRLPVVTRLPARAAWLLRPAAGLLILLGAVLSVPGPALAADGPNAQTGHELAPAIAEWLSSTCPFGDWVPDVDTVCEDWDIAYFRAATPSQLHDQPWFLAVSHSSVIVHPDNTVTELYNLQRQLTK